jgi:hypothetical protein
MGRVGNNLKMEGIMKYEEILKLKIDNSDFDKDLTIKGYFKLLLGELWDEGEGFSGKRPFGNSGWEYDLYKPLIVAGLVKGRVGECGCVDNVDYESADKLISELINSL